MTDLTPEQQQALAKIAADFKTKIRKLNVGISIRVGDGPSIEIVPPPGKEPAK